MSELTFRQAQEAVVRFLDEWDKKYKKHLDNRFYIFTHLSEEMGELARDIINAELDLTPDRTPAEPGQRQEATRRIADDLGDVLIHLLELANACGIDLAAAFQAAMASNRKRFNMQ